MKIRILWIGRFCITDPTLGSREVALASSSSKEELLQLLHLNLALFVFKFVQFKYQEVAWPSGLRRWFKAPVSSEARVRISPLPK